MKNKGIALLTLLLSASAVMASSYEAEDQAYENELGKCCYRVPEGHLYCEHNKTREECSEIQGHFVPNNS